MSHARLEAVGSDLEPCAALFGRLEAVVDASWKSGPRGLAEMARLRVTMGSETAPQARGAIYFLRGCEWAPIPAMAPGLGGRPDKSGLPL